VKASHFVPRSRLVDRSDVLTSYAVGRKTLHIGMGGFIDDHEETQKELAAPSSSLHCNLFRVAASLTGIDINPLAIEIMRRTVPGRYFVGDIMDVSLPDRFRDDLFDVIIFGDVVEHLDNFGIALRNLSRMLGPDGLLVISTSNAFYFGAIVKMLFRYEVTHGEHTCHFSYLTLKRTLAMNGLDLVDFMFYTHKRPPPLDTWMARLDHYVSNAVARVLPQFAMGIIAATQPRAG
jgi:SAM-dependent methyltransferase